MNNFNLKTGMTGKAETIVDENNTALKFGSGTINVFATPAMIGLMEAAAIDCVDRNLPEGYASVGTKVEIKHIAATPLGMKVSAEAELTEVDGLKLKFKVYAFDEKEKIGEGVHNRYIVKLNEFLKNTEQKIKI